MSQIKDARDSFWVDFQFRLKKRTILVSEKVENVNILMDDAISDFKTNGDANRTINLLKMLQTEIENLFDSLSVQELKPADMDSLTAICRRFNEDLIIQEVRDLHTEERFCSEEVKKPPYLGKDKMSSFAETNFPFGPTKMRGSVKSESMSPKKGEEIRDIEHEDFPIQNKNPNTEEKKIVVEVFSENVEVIEGNAIYINNDEKEKREPKILLNSVPVDIQVADQNNEQHRISESLKIRKEIDELLELIKAEYGEHKLDETHKLVEKFKNLENTLETEDLDYYKQKTRLNQILLSDIETYYKQARKILEELEDEEGYTVESVKKGLTIKYKSVAGNSVSLKMEGIVDIPIFNMIALIYEMEGYSLWMPFCKEGKEVKRIARASKAGYIKYSIPPPVFDREAYIYGVGFDRTMDNGSVLIVAKSIHDDENTCKMLNVDIPTTSKTTRLDMEYMGGSFYPISDTSFKMSIVAKVDLKIKFLPLSLINWIVRKAASFLLDRIVKKARNLKGTLWEKKIQENREFYGWLETKITAYLKEKGIDGEQKVENKE